jgi:2-dehydro-3-deoxyphosphogluconate aldolase / (4S)-4-hydroxy-2-oxoglutarate aldolase
MKMTDVLSHILKHKIVAIIRGANPGDVLKIAEALFAGGVKVLEVTMNSANALEVIKQLSETMKNKMQTGAGTVLDAETAKSAISAGAKFIISPCLNTEVIKTTKELGAVSIPGAFTPTEIVNAFNNGGDIIKVFPASSNINYIKDIRGPLPNIPLMPTGGINLLNARKYFQAGAVAVGIGSALVDTKQEVTEEYLKQLTVRAQKFVQIVTNL